MMFKSVLNAKVKVLSLKLRDLVLVLFSNSKRLAHLAMVKEGKSLRSAMFAMEINKLKALMSSLYSLRKESKMVTNM